MVEILRSRTITQVNEFAFVFLDHNGDLARSKNIRGLGMQMPIQPQLPRCAPPEIWPVSEHPQTCASFSSNSGMPRWYRYVRGRGTTGERRGLESALLIRNRTIDDRRQFLWTAA